MTEVEWLACPERDWLLDHAMPHMGPRKLRLFACAVMRRLWPLLTDARSRRAVEVAELLAEEEGYMDGGWRKHYDLCFATYAAARAAEEEIVEGPPHFLARAALLTLATVRYAIPYHIKYHASFVAPLVANAPGKATREALHAELLAQCRLVRELCGNPFRPVVVEPAWLRWHDRIVARMAQEIYDEQSFDDLPILADALEDAGCDQAALLGHCRFGGEHVRGCWALDRLLGKE